MSYVDPSPGANDGNASLSPEEIEIIRDFLLQKRSEILESQASRLSELSDPNDRHHLADLEEMASDTVDTDSLCQILNIEGSTIAQIDAALDKIAAGTYGTCEECEMPIARARLEALPFASLCVACKRLRELSPEPSDE
ncbi:MAG: TraR/DksA family transcriptional regulator [Planctomycetes bacterium]|nr:TraR/DksA family transcriptional regulator [Planctomycetota bacterium]